MQQRSLSEHQGVSAHEGTSTEWTTKDRGSWSCTRSTRCCRLSPLSAAHLWTWLLLGALLVPGAWSFLSEEQEELLVELHNHYRGQVSPSASAMMPLKWDTSLKLLAENYAAKCIWNHNADLEDTGENLFVGTGPLDLREALEKWFLEWMDYDFNNNSCDEDKMCGHYTQMVWADTHRFGCAFHLCNNMEGLAWERVSFLVCNYYPAGNYEGERPYVEGDWCSRCPENLQKCENNLCVPDNIDEEDGEGVDDEWGTIAPTVMFETSPQPTVMENDTPPPSPLPVTTTAILPASPSTSEDDGEDTPPPDTPAPGTPPPKFRYTTTLNEVDLVDETIQMEEESMTGQKIEKDQALNPIGKSNTVNAASASAASLLLACLTGILTLRL